MNNSGKKATGKFWLDSWGKFSYNKSDSSSYSKDPSKEEVVMRHSIPIRIAQIVVISCVVLANFGVLSPNHAHKVEASESYANQSSTKAGVFPVIEVFPDSFDYGFDYGSFVVDSFRIYNLGFDTLNYELSTIPVKMDTIQEVNIIIGPTASGQNLTRGSIIKATTDMVLLEFGYVFDVITQTQIEHFIFESAADTGTYTKIFSTVQIYDSLGSPQSTSSGPIYVPMDSGKYYIIGVSWDQPLYYKYLDSSGYPCWCSYLGAFVRESNFPSDSSYYISSISGSKSYESSILAGFPLHIDILSDMSGSVSAQDTATVLFQVSKDKPPPTISYGNSSHICISSNDPDNPLVHVAILAKFMGIEDEFKKTIPSGFKLCQNFPNPFNSNTTIRFELPVRSRVDLNVYNVSGQEITNLIDGRTFRAGWHQVEFNTSSLSSGIYFYRLQAGDHYSETKKMILLK